MDNAAFRQMLAKATDGAKRGGGGGDKDELRSIIETEDKRAKQLEKKKEKNREKNEAQAAARGGKPGAADAGGYRDRANERRKEANPDYDDALTQMVALDVEKSKYLGGDVEHTHLVRGLDYALLSKVRGEMHGSAPPQQPASGDGGGEPEKRAADVGTPVEPGALGLVAARTHVGKAIAAHLRRIAAADAPSAPRPANRRRRPALECVCVVVRARAPSRARPRERDATRSFAGT